jgi:hypothetical protein
MGCHTLRRGSPGVLLDKALGGTDDLMPCLSARIQGAPGQASGPFDLQGESKARLVASAACGTTAPLPSRVAGPRRGTCEWARGSRGVVVQGERRSRAATSHEPLARIRGWQLGGTKWGSQQSDAPPNTTDDGASDGSM